MPQLPEPAINVPMFDETGGWVQDPDMSYEEFRIAIQYDGGHHATPAPRRSDIYRDESAPGLGWIVVVLAPRPHRFAKKGRPASKLSDPFG